MFPRFFLSKNYLDTNKALEEAKRLPFILHTDMDLVGQVKAISLRSSDSLPTSLYRDSVPEKPEDFSYTKLYYSNPGIKAIVDFFKVDKARIRVHKQPPNTFVKPHLDYNNEGVEKPEDSLLRIIVHLNSDPDFTYLLNYKGNKAYLAVEAGKVLIFDPDQVYHGIKNDSNQDRYSIVMVVRPNKWLVNYILGNC